MPRIDDVSKVSVYRPVADRTARLLVERFHYSQRMPSSITLCYGHLVDSTLVSVVIYSHATGRRDVPLWELTRLVRTDSYEEPLTKLISKSLGYVRANKMTDLIVSFADSEEDHHGGIYQASSWLYDGMTNSRVDGFNIDGVFVPARTCNSIYGTSSIDGLKDRLPKSTVEPHFDSGKHRYWKALSKSGMTRAVSIGLKSLAYPKPILDVKDGGMVSQPIHKRKGRRELPPPNVQSVKSTRIVVGRPVTPSRSSRDS